MARVKLSSSVGSLADRPPAGEQQRDAPSGEAPERDGRPVFVATGALRARALRAVGYVAGTLVVLWLAALIAGALGAGRLPAVPFPALGALAEAPTAHDARQAAPPASLPRAISSDGIVGRGPAAASAPVRRASRDRSRSQGPASTRTPAGVRRTAPRGDARTAPGSGFDPRREVGSGPQPAVGQPGAGSLPSPPAGPQPRGRAPTRPAPAPAPSPPKTGKARAPSDEPPRSGSSAAPPASPPGDPPVTTPGLVHRPTAD